MTGRSATQSVISSPAENVRCSWAAVVKGAIIKSLGLYTQKLPVVIRCPRHYGIKIRAQFSAYKHKPSDAEVDVEGVSWACNQIRWFVQKGDAIFPGKAIVISYDCHWSMKASDYPARRRSSGSQATESVFRDLVFVASAANDPPTRLDELVRGEPSFICASLHHAFN